MSSCGWVVAPTLRQCGPQVQAPWHHGGHGAADIVGPVARPVVRAAVGTQECTQIGENGLSELFWGICVHCCAVGLGCGWPWDRNSVHKWEDRASPRRIGAFVYTVAPREDRASDRGDAGVYTNRWKWPPRSRFWGICVHCCDASCVEWHERLNHHGVPAAPPRWPPLA